MNFFETPTSNGPYKEVWFELLTDEEREEIERCQFNSSKSSQDISSSDNTS